MMHMMHNLFDHFVPFLLGKSIDLTEEETAPDVVERLFTHYNMEKKKVLLNDILQQGRVIRNTQFSRFIQSTTCERKNSTKSQVLPFLTNPPLLSSKNTTVSTFTDQAFQKA